VVPSGADDDEGDIRLGYPGDDASAWFVERHAVAVKPRRTAVLVEEHLSPQHQRVRIDPSQGL
jgi:hypothetical protein